MKTVYLAIWGSIAAIAMLGSALGADVANITTASASPTVMQSQPYTGTRTLQYRTGDVVEVHVKRGMLTAIQIEGEALMRIEYGNQDAWHADAQKGTNVFFVRPDEHPSTKGTPATDLVVTTTRGNLYVFLLQEVVIQPDLSIVVQPAGELKKVADGPPKWIEADKVASIQAQADDARQQAERAKSDAEAAKAAYEKKVENAKTTVELSYPKSLDFAYSFDRDVFPFHIQSVWNDGKFTYIRLNPDETPALYAMRDGKPQLVDAQYAEGLYMIPQKLDGEFYLQIGKKKTPVVYKGSK